MSQSFGAFACVTACCATMHVAQAETALVATATNFAEAAERIARAFEKQSNHHIKLSFGATGKLYAQIKVGAPFDALLAADQERPRRLIAEKLANATSHFTYAIGKLTLWSADPNRINGRPKSILSSTSTRAIAIANPALAPYGLAARQALEKLELWRATEPRIVTAENIGQTFALVATGNATVGFIATPQLNSTKARAVGGSRWDVPADLHQPIRQDAVLLKHGAANTAAREFLSYLKSAKARAIIIKLGYNVPSEKG